MCLYTHTTHLISAQTSTTHVHLAGPLTSTPPVHTPACLCYALSKMDEKNKLYFGDNLKILRDYVEDTSVDLIYLDPACPPRRACAGRALRD